MCSTCNGTELTKIELETMGKVSQLWIDTTIFSYRIRPVRSSERLQLHVHI